MSDFIPNSFQTPNIYVDQVMYLLTPEEWKVLLYAVRKIFGFQKRQDRISLHQFIAGTLSRDNTRRDHGTGLGRSTVIKALDHLIEFGLMLELDENDPRKNEGPLYALQLDEERVNFDAMRRRLATRKHTEGKRTIKAREMALEKILNENKEDGGETPSVAQTPSVRQTPSVAQQGVSLSDRPTPVCRTDTQYPIETQIKSRKRAAKPRTPDKPEKKHDPLLEHPAVVTYRDVMHLTPNDVQRRLIAEGVGENGRLDDWRAILTDWKAHGWKPGNIPGLLEKFSNTKGAYGTPSTDPQPPSDEQLAAAERINAARAAKQH